MYPERRKHRRILTLKHFKWALILVVVFLAGLSIEVSTRTTPGEYGRLVKKEIPRSDDIRPQPPAVVTEAPVADQSAADPMLLEPGVRAQEFLSTTTTVPPAPIAQTPGNGQAVIVAGDASGITITRTRDAAKRPVLAGGIFKQSAQ
jgi:hypothetical protein